MAAGGAEVSDEFEVPTDLAAGPASAARRDGWRIWQYLRERTGRAFESWEIQTALGLWTGYSTRLAWARKYALDHGEIVTYAEHREGRWLVRHLLPESEGGQNFVPVMTRELSIAGQETNQHRVLLWHAANAADPVERAYANALAASREAVLGVHKAWEEFAFKAMADRREGQPSTVE